MNLRGRDNCGIANSLKRLVEYSKSQPTRNLKFFPSSRTEKDDFTCADCGLAFVTKFLLSLHRSTQCVLLPHACSKCDLRFATRTSLLQHRRIHSKSESSKDCDGSDRIESPPVVVAYRCDACNLAFRGSSKFLRHERLHSGKRSFQCHRCNLGFNWKSNLTRHLKSPCVRDELEAESCNRTSSISRPAMDDHRSKGRSREIRASSKNCVVKMETAQGEICKTAKSNEIELDLLLTDVKSEQKTIKNEESLKFFADKNLDRSRTWKSQCKQDREVPPRRYGCKHCDMGFRYRSDLLRHLGTHDIVKPFQCDYCELGFNWKSNLVRHQRRFHFGIKAYGCDQCDLSFVKKYHLSRHKKTHDEEDDTDDTPKSKQHRTWKDPNEDIPFETSDLDRRREANNTATLHLDSSGDKSVVELPIKQENNPEQLHKSPALRKKRGKYKIRIKSGENKTQKQFVEIKIDDGALRRTEKYITDNDTGITQDLDSLIQIVNVKDECNEDFKGVSRNSFNLDRSPTVNTVALQSTSYAEKSSVKTGDCVALNQGNNEFQRRKRAKYKIRDQSDLSENRIQSEGVVSNGSVKDENYLVNCHSDTAQDLALITQESNASNCNDKSKDISLQSDISDGSSTSIRSSRGKKRKNNSDSTETEIQQLFPCSYCDRVFSRRSSHFQHERSHSRKPLSCEVCQRSFERKSVLQRHYLTHTGEKSFKCDVCCRCFRQKSQLMQHSRIHSGSRPHECETCLQRFNRRSILKRHQVIHSGEKPFQCDLCLRCFSRKSILDQHQIVHRKRNRNQAECEEYCPRRKMSPQRERLQAGTAAASHTYNTRFSLKQENLDDCQDGTHSNTQDQPAEVNHSLPNHSNQGQMYCKADERTSQSRKPQEQTHLNTNEEMTKPSRCYGDHSDQQESDYCMPHPDDLQDASNDQEQMYYKADERTSQSHNSQEQTHQNTKSQEMAKAGQVYVHRSDLQDPDYYIPEADGLTNIRHEEPEYYEADSENCSLEASIPYDHHENIHFIEDPEHYEAESTDENAEDLVKIPTIQKEPENNLSHAKVTNDPDARRLTIIHIQSSSSDKSQGDENRAPPNERREDYDETRSEEIQLSQITASGDKHEISPLYQAFGRLEEFSNSDSHVANNSEKEISDQEFKPGEICCDQKCPVDSSNTENVSLLDDFSTAEIAIDQTDSVKRKIDCFVSKLKDENDVEDLDSEKRLKQHKTSISTDRITTIVAIEDHEYCIDLYSDFKSADLKEKNSSDSRKVDNFNSSLEVNNTEDTEGIPPDRNIADGNSTDNDHSLEPVHLINSNLDQASEIPELNEKTRQNLELVRFEEINLDQQPARYVEIRTDQDPIRCKEIVGDQPVVQFEVPDTKDLDCCEEINIHEELVSQEKMRVNHASNDRERQDNVIDDPDCKNTQTFETLERNSFPKQNTKEIPGVAIVKQKGEMNATELHVDTDVDNDCALKNRDKEKFNAHGNCDYPEESTNDPDSSSFVERSSDPNKNPDKSEIIAEKDLIQCEDISTTHNASQNEDFSEQVGLSNIDIPIRQNLHQNKTSSDLGGEDLPSERCQLELHTASDLNENRNTSLNSLNTNNSVKLQKGTISGFDPTRNTSTGNALDSAYVEKVKPGHITKRSSKTRSGMKRLRRQDSEIDKMLDLLKDISIEDVDYRQEDVNRNSETRLRRITDQDQPNLYTQTHSENEKVFNHLIPAQHEDVCTIQNPSFDEPFQNISIEDIDCHQDDTSRYSDTRLQRITDEDQSKLFTHSENERGFNYLSPVQLEGNCTFQNPAFEEPFISDQQAIQLVNEYVGYEKISIQQNITVEHFVGCGEMSENDEQIRFMNAGSVRNSALPIQCNPVRFEPMPIRPVELFPNRNLVQREEAYMRNQHGAVRYDQMYIHPLQYHENMRMAQSLVRNEEISSFSVQYEQTSTDTINQYSNFPTHPDKNVRMPKISYQEQKLSKTIQNCHERKMMSGFDSKRNNLMSGFDSKRNKQVRSCYEKLRREVVRKHQEHASFGSKNQFGCERCDQCFKRKEDLIRHRFTEHEKNRF